MRWVSAGHFHITLKFLGEVENKRLLEAQRALSALAGRFEPFDFTVSGIGAFPDFERAQVFWAGIAEGAETLGRLAAETEKEFQAIGFPKETRPFHAHVTLGRVRSLKNNESLQKMISVMKQEERSQGFRGRAGRFSFYKSTLTPEGPVYEVLSRHELSEKK